MIVEGFLLFDEFRVKVVVVVVGGFGVGWVVGCGIFIVFLN